ncbi:class I SAM-dependent methyltransferase [Pedobacter yulinensis]|uniref:Class I SAM-dependent methyltransferase n=1 Tax=Pedobacter yulinensis TaxID=2126353 RepID=A0A2T3HGM8_9SPHI|nr:class I SAM-dependent methyltransferase [Pedobacter yulinensis]
MKKSTTDEIRARFDADVERFSNLETGQQTIMDAPLGLELITGAAARLHWQATAVLDIGCGAGNFTLKLLEKLPGLDCTLVDLSRPMLDRAADRVSAVTSGKVITVQADIRTADLTAQGYDIILAGAVFHHLRSTEEWRAVFSNMYHLLKPGGGIWISDLVSHEPPALENLFRERYADYLENIGGQAYQQRVFAYIDEEDTPRSTAFQLLLLKECGFSAVEILHKNTCFAAFGAVK